MASILTSTTINQAIAPGLLLWRREKRRLLRRWRRLMLLPETVLVTAIFVFGVTVADKYDYQPGQPALASVNDVLQDGVPSPAARHRQKMLQQKLRRDPHKLVTLDRNDVLNALSYPDLRRSEGNITILQFRGEGCILDLYLQDGSKTALNYEFRSRQTAEFDMSPGKTAMHPQSCVEDILKSRHI